MASVPYQALVGALLYLVQGSRPDIAFAVGDVSRYNSCYGKEHWMAAKRILRYLKGTKDYKLYFNHSSDGKVLGFADADWASDVDSRRSCTGYLFTMQGAAISWKSHRQATIALSTTEAEYTVSRTNHGVE